MRSLLGGLVIVGFMVGACGGPGVPTASLPGAPATPPAGASPATTPVQPPAAGAGTVSVTLAGGPDAGTYTGSDNPNCSFGLIGPGGWGVQYSISEAAADQLSSLQVVSAAPGMADDEDAFFEGTEFLMTVTIGTLFAEGSREYEVAVRTEAADEESSGTGSAQMTDNGSTAVLHATGTTADGVGIDATVNCPSVIRQ